MRGDRELPPAFTPLGKGDDRRIVMLKVSHAALGLMSAREAEKRKKYEDTLEKLRSDGWEPVLYTLVLGTLGEIPSTAALVLEELGVCGSELDKLLADIHMIAIGKADVCIQTESLSHEEISGRPLGGSSGRYKRKDMEQSEGSPTKKSKKVLTVRTEMCDVSVRKAVQKREGKRKKK